MKLWENINDPILENEIWKIIKGFPDCQVSNFGRTKSFKCDKINGKILKQDVNKNFFYLQVKLSNKNRKRKTKKVHILVFENFHDYKLKSNECIHHIDFIKENNYFENLVVMLKKEHQVLHKTGENNQFFGKHHSEKTKNKISEKIKEDYKKNNILNNLYHRGENSPNHKLSNQDIFDIRRSLELKLYTPKQLSWMFDISIVMIYKIKSNEYWSHIGVNNV